MIISRVVIFSGRALMCYCTGGGRSRNEGQTEEQIGEYMSCVVFCFVREGQKTM